MTESQYVDEINALYPLEIVQYYSPGYEQTLLSKLENEWEWSKKSKCYDYHIK